MGATFTESAPPSAYAGLPSAKQLNAEAEKNNLTDATKQSQSFQVYQFALNQSKKDDEESKHSAGNLIIGSKLTHETIFHAAYYSARQYNKLTKEWETHPEIDISASIKVEKISATSNKWIKVADATSAWRFELTVDHLGGDNPTLDGAYNILDDSGHSEEYVWSGSYTTSSVRTESVSVIDVTKPTDLDPDATLQLLQSISSTQELEETVNINGQKNIMKAGSDGAQTRGDEIMLRIMFHTLDNETKKLFFGDTLRDLEAVEKKILDANYDFFKAGAIHYLTDSLKGSKSVEEGLSKKIKGGRYTQFLRALTTLKPPQTGADPVVTYGMDRERDKDLLAKLQAQCSTATMRCYEEGYKIQVPTWKRFVKHPVYWFNVYANYLRSPEFVESWVAALPEEGQVKHQVQGWGHKLSLLKNAALQNPLYAVEGAALDVAGVTDYLLGKSHLAMAYHQIVDEEFLKNARTLFEKMRATKPSKQYEAELAARADYSREIDIGIQHETVSILERLVDENSKLAIESRQYWEKRTPPGGKPGRLTVAQIIKSWEEEATRVKEQEERLRWIRLQDNMPPLEQGSVKPLWDRIKAGAQKGGSALVKLFKTVFHTGIFAVLTLQLKELSGSIDLVEHGRLICSLAAEGVNAIGWVGRRVLDWLWHRGTVFKRSIAFFNDTLSEGGKSFGKRLGRAVVGSIGKIVRTLGLLGAVFNIISSYWDMNKASEMRDDDAEKYLIYTKVQFSLACIETTLIVTDIVAEIFGATRIVAISGPLAIAVGVITLVVAFIYYFFFAPDQNADVKKFLNGPAKLYHDYVE